MHFFQTLLKKPVAVHLANHPFLRDFTPAQRTALSGCAASRRFAAGHYLWRQGERATALYLVCSGDVSLEIFVPGQGPIEIDTIREGELLGWSWLLRPYRWHFDARALSAVHAIALDGECLRAKSEADQALGYQVLKQIAPAIQARLDATRLKLLHLYSPVGSSSS